MAKIGRAITKNGKTLFTLQTSVAAEELRERLLPWEPWAIRVDFSNGVSTKDFTRRSPFDEQPLTRFSVVEAAIPFTEISGSRLLDVGCNGFYNCAHAAQKYGLSCTASISYRDTLKSRVFSQGLPTLVRNFLSRARKHSRATC